MTCTRLSTTLALFCLTVSVGAQDKPTGGHQGGDQPQGRPADKGANLGKQGGHGRTDEESEKERLSREKFGGADGVGKAQDGDELNPGKGENVVINHGARGFCRLDASVRPKRLLPGQTGTLMVTMVLEGDSVLTAPANVVVSYMGGTLTVGSSSVRPATRASVAKAYAGQLVHDNFALVEMPITMPPTAALGTKHHAALDFEFELFQGATGKHLGQFKERVSVACEVGNVRDPLVSASAPSATATATHASGSDSPSAPGPGTSGEVPAGRADSAVLPQAAPIEAPVSSVVSPSDAVADPIGDGELPVESTSTTPVLIGGVGALAAVLLLLLLRRR
jgi:hypothetical protein